MPSCSLLKILIHNIGMQGYTRREELSEGGEFPLQETEQWICKFLVDVSDGLGALVQHW